MCAKLRIGLRKGSSYYKHRGSFLVEFNTDLKQLVCGGVDVVCDWVSYGVMPRVGPTDGLVFHCSLIRILRVQVFVSLDAMAFHSGVSMSRPQSQCEATLTQVESIMRLVAAVSS